MGEAAIAGRAGNERLWDIGTRIYPTTTPLLRAPEVARRILELQLRCRGVVRADQFGYLFDAKQPPGADRVLAQLVRDGVAVPVTIEGLAGDYYVHADNVDVRFAPRTTLLCPFDQLIRDRDRTEALFGFRYKLEMYVPVAKREFGYYVLPILHGSELIGRVDSAMDRKTGRYAVKNVYAEPGSPATASAGPAIAGAVRELAEWLGATAVDVGTVPRPWAKSLRAV